MANSVFDTHSVFNQPPELRGYNAWEQDSLLQRQLTLHAPWACALAADYGAQVGGSLLEAGFLAEDFAPQFNSHDRFGKRIDRVDYHPAYHQLMGAAFATGWPVLPWVDDRPGAHVARAALEYLHHQADSGSGCPLTMTFAALPVIRKCEARASEWMPGLTSGQYDPTDRPWFEKAGVTIGMGMTEKQGGSDVRANTTVAKPLAGAEPGMPYALTGHKWFMSAPMSDAFLVLAQAQAGLSCFLMPRWLPEGRLNSIRIQRLKNKLGNRSNASSEVEFHGATGWLLGDPGRGIATIIEMVALTRFDCMVGSTALMRQAVVQALHHCSYREAFGKRLLDQPLMQNVLADLVVESEAALLLSIRTAHALDESQASARQQSFVRLVTAIGKYWLCKRAPAQVYEAMECLGGAGYIEESILPRLYREAPVNAIWEGSGNVQCLDMLRALERDSDSLQVLWDELRAAKGLQPDYDNYLRATERELANPDNREYRARRLAERLALALQGSLLLRSDNAAVAEVFCRSRLGGEGYGLYGNLVDPERCATIIQSAWPGL